MKWLCVREMGTRAHAANVCVLMHFPLQRKHTVHRLLVSFLLLHYSKVLFLENVFSPFSATEQWVRQQV